MSDTRGLAIASPGGDPERIGLSRKLLAPAMLESEGIPSSLRMSALVIALLLAAFVGWAAAVPIAETAATTGQLVPSGRVRTLKHPRGGKLRELRVREGERVEPGQILMVLDTTPLEIELRQILAREVALSTKARRLRAIGEEQPLDLTGVPPAFRELADRQRATYAAQIAARDARRRLYREQIRQQQAELDRIDAMRRTLERRRKLLAEELAMRKRLYRKKLASKLTYLDIQQRMNAAEGDLASLLRERERALGALREARARLEEFEADFHEQALRELGEVTAELEEVRRMRRRQEEKIREMTIRAPVAGRVQGLGDLRPGSLVAPDRPIAQIVPFGDRLIAELRIPPDKIGRLAPGMPVRLKVQTFDYARFGSVQGTLRLLSPTTLTDAKGRPYYLAQVELEGEWIGPAGHAYRLRPGMTVEGDIRTGEKTLLQYLLKPIYATAEGAFHER